MAVMLLPDLIYSLILKDVMLTCNEPQTSSPNPFVLATEVVWLIWAVFDFFFMHTNPCNRWNAMVLQGEKYTLTPMV